jgi:hypothetical protein
VQIGKINQVDDHLWRSSKYGSANYITGCEFKFRRLLLKHDLTRRLFDEIGIELCERGLMMKEGTLVDRRSK